VTEPTTIEILVSWLVRVTIVCLLALSCSRWLRARSAGVQHGIWALALFSCLVPPLVAFPGLSVEWSSTNPSVEARTPLFTLGIVGVYLAGVLAFLVAGWRQERERQRLCAASSLAVPPHIQQRLVALASAMQVKRVPGIQMVDASQGAALVDWRRPTILLPKNFVEGLTDDSLTHVLAHELAHLHQRDLLLNLLRFVTCALWWFHPLVWSVARRQLETREECCDALVLRLTQAQPSHYARSLLDAAACSFGTTPAWGMAFLGSNDSALEQRLRRLPEHGDTVPGWRWRVVMLLVLGMVSLPAWVVSRPVADTPVASSLQELLQTIQTRHANGHHAHRHSH